TAANASKYSCASVESWTKTNAASMPSRIIFSRPMSFSTITLSTTICVNTGKSNCRKLTATASPSACSKITLNRERNGRTQACFPELLLTLGCNRTVLNNQSTSSQIPVAEFCAARARDRQRAQAAHQRRRARSNGCLPSALLLEAACAEDCETRFSTDAPPTQ